MANMQLQCATMLALVILLLPLVACRHLFFGETWSGKTTLINLACGTYEPVAAPDKGQIGSTTKKVKGILCGDTEAVDTIGVFDYDEDASLRIGVTEVQTTLLEHVEAHGLSSVLFVWPSLKRQANQELENIFLTLRRLLPEVQMAIVNNEFPGYSSHVPVQYHKKFKLPLLNVNENDTTALQGWMNSHNDLLKVSLPKDWRDMVKKFDIDDLRQALLSASLMACSTVKDQLQAITSKIDGIPQPEKSCECGDCNSCAQDCRRSESYCCSSIMGVCTATCTNKWIDENCQKQVTHCNERCEEGRRACYATCTAGHAEIVSKTQEQLAGLIAAFQSVSTSNKALLETCDRFRISGMSHTEL